MADRQRIVILGAGGRLGAMLTREFSRQHEVTAFDRAALDLSNIVDLRSKIEKFEFDLLINCAAFTNVDLCETERVRAFQINAEAPGALAEICAHKKVKLIHFSTDYVFDGEKKTPYLETDPANPISAYGESKRAGEEKVLAAGDAVSVPIGKQTASPTVIRVSWVFGPDRPSFIDGIIKRAMESEHVEAIADKFSAPTYTRDIAEMLPSLFAIDSGGRVGALRRPRTPQRGVPTNTDVDLAGGILHFANAGECSWQEYGQHAIDCCHSLGIPLKAKTVAPLKMADMTRLRQGSGGQANWIARRPVYSVLSTQKYAALTKNAPRAWRDAVADYIERSYSKK